MFYTVSSRMSSSEDSGLSWRQTELNLEQRLLQTHLSDYMSLDVTREHDEDVLYPEHHGSCLSKVELKPNLM